MVNLNKSAITFGSRVQGGVKTSLRQCLQIYNDGGGGKYLGLPEQIGQKKKEIFQHIVEKVEQRTRSWKYKFLSDAGKEILLKTVALAMPIYTMNCFKLPKGICDDINRVLSRFWWSKGDNKGLSWLNWKRLSLPKKEGGLGFPDIEQFNRALLGKQVWRLLLNPTSLAGRLLKARYYPNTTIIDSTAGTKPSYLWQSLQEGKEVVKQGLRCIVGNGKNIRVWSDPWLNTSPPRPPQRRDNTLSDTIMVNELMCPNSRGWNKQLIERLIVPEDVAEIYKLKLNSFDSEDIIGWHYTQDGQYSVKSGYWLATHIHPNTVRPPTGARELKHRIWKLNTALKLKHFMWRLLAKAIAVGSILKERRIVDNIQCKRCFNGDETLEHLFFTCPYVVSIWRSIGFPMLQITTGALSFEQRVLLILDYVRNNDLSDYHKQVPIWTLWRIWKSRNCLLYQHKNWSWNKTSKAIQRDIHEWLAANMRTTKDDDNLQTWGDRTRVSWSRPPRGWVKCNYDCSYYQSNSTAKAGWIIRDAEGCFLEAGSKTGNHCCSVLEAELHALLMALQQAWIRGYRSVIFEGDNQQLFLLLEDRSHHFGLYNWLREIHHWRVKFIQVKFFWTQRSCNAAADTLAKLHDPKNICCQFNYPPVCLSNVLLTDCLNSS